jgi:hypothetical protein
MIDPLAPSLDDDLELELIRKRADGLKWLINEERHGQAI